MPGKMIYIADEMDFMRSIQSAMEADGPEDLTASTNDAMRRANSTTNRPSTDPTRTRRIRSKKMLPILKEAI